MSDTVKMRQVKRGTEFDGFGSQAAEPLMTDLPGEGEIHYNYTTRMIHFLDGSFVAPGFGIPLSAKALEHPGIKRLVENDELRTKKPADTIDETDTSRLVHDSGDVNRSAMLSNIEEHTGTGS